MGFFTLFSTPDINTGVEKFRATEGAVLLDVRTPEEYRQGHIDGSINLPPNNISDIVTIIKDKNTSLYVHCLSGARSEQAVSFLKRMGYKNATNIGGISKYRGKVVK